ncbi:hypothetical protein HHL19_16545 [Streptomyces sp. R302]|uniref:hypothetical protein n=1 Tax=unclassified Streptomyces TaxID=2593676 RepID=UPI00145F9F1D|nr:MULTISPECIES: hypothetical protein [unclassified Streptomyces]NML55379.1 hypothetical protein [Streptomyces sp. R301]NML80251.1 hypothetical protein [Streptomyces sp. R302]
MTTPPGDTPARSRLRPAEPRPTRWYEYSHTATGPEYWLRYLIGEPHDFAYAVPRRIACRILRRHNATCAGRLDHQHLRRRTS